MTITIAAILIAFALGPFVAKLIYGMQLHRHESERIARQNAPIKTIDDVDTRR